jgi:hypothetical protein
LTFSLDQCYTVITILDFGFTIYEVMAYMA